MEQNIQLLIETQGLDSRIYNLKKASEEKPRELKRFKERVQAKKDDLAASEQELTSIQLKRKDKELNLQEKEGDIKKRQSQLYQIKSNKEYKAILTEIEGVKADNSVLEEDIIAILDAIDNAVEEISGEKKDLKTE